MRESRARYRQKRKQERSTHRRSHRYGVRSATFWKSSISSCTSAARAMARRWSTYKVSSVEQVCHTRMPRPSDTHGIGRAAEDVHDGDCVEEGVTREDVSTVHLCLDYGRRVGGVWERRTLASGRARGDALCTWQPCSTPAPFLHRIRHAIGTTRGIRVPD